MRKIYDGIEIAAGMPVLIQVGLLTDRLGGMSFMIQASLVVPVTAALIKSAFRRPNKDKRIVIVDGQVTVEDADDAASATTTG
jgi:hypothetical protein